MLSYVIWAVVVLRSIGMLGLSVAENNCKDLSVEQSGLVACFGCSHYDADTNSCIEGDKWSRRCEANFPTDTLEEWNEDLAGF